LIVKNRLDPVSGWFEDAEKRASPNFDARPAGIEVDLIVLHAISLPPGVFGGGYIHEFFLNRLRNSAHPYFAEIAALRVSAHLLIDRAGDLTQFVSTHARAWHCGDSRHAGRVACNDFSIGVELEGCDEQEFTGQQYGRLNAVLSELVRVYPGLTADTIVGHSDIAPARKTDPGPFFDWDRMRSGLGDAMAAASGLCR